LEQLALKGLKCAQKWHTRSERTLTFNRKETKASVHHPPAVEWRMITYSIVSVCHH